MGPVVRLLALGAAVLVTAVLLLLSRGGRDPAPAASPADEPVREAGVSSAAQLEPLPADVEITTPEELRAFKLRCDAAEASDAPWLRQLALNAEDPLVAGQAIQALGRLGLFDGDPAYLALLDDARVRVRHESVRALGRSGDAGVTPSLAPLLADADPTTRALAIQALGALPGVRARSVLEDYERSGNPGETERAFLRAALRPAPMRVGQRSGAEARSPVENDG